MTDINWKEAVEAWKPNNMVAYQSESPFYKFYLETHAEPEFYTENTCRLSDEELADLERVENEFNAWQKKLADIAGLEYEPIQLLWRV